MDIKNLNLAKNIDIINEYLLSKPEGIFELLPEHMEASLKVRMQEMLKAIEFNDLVGLMIANGLIDDTKTNKSGLKYYSFTTDGLTLYLNGGMFHKVKADKYKNNLYKYGQYAVIIAGVYYLIEISLKQLPIIFSHFCLSPF